MQFEKYISNVTYTNVFFLMGDFFRISSYRLFEKSLLEGKFNYFCFKNDFSVSEEEFAKKIIQIMDWLRVQNSLRGRNIIVGHSRGAHVAILISQILKNKAGYVLINPLIRIEGIREKRDIRLVAECCISMVFKHTIQLSYRTFAKRFLDKKQSYELKRNIYSQSDAIKIREFFNITVLKAFMPNKYEIFCSKEDRAIDYDVLLEKIRYLKEKWQVQFSINELEGTHCNFMFDENEENRRKIISSINSLIKTKGANMTDLRLDKIAQRMKGNFENKIIYHEKGVRISKIFHEVYEDALKVMYYITNIIGLVKGNRVGIVADNSYEWIVFDVACYYSGIVLVPFHKTDFDRTKIKQLFDMFELNSMVVDFECSTENIGFEASIIEVNKLQKVIMGENIFQGDLHDWNENETITLVSTSGTTSEPKFIEINSKPFNDFLSYGIDMYGLNHEDRIIVFIPLSHYGQRIYVYGAMVIGFDIVLCNVTTMQIMMYRDKPTIIVAVPYFYETIYNSFYARISAKKWTKKLFDLFMNKFDKIPTFIYKLYDKYMLKPFQNLFGGNIRLLITGSAPISGDLVDFYHKMGIGLYEGYGTNETGVIALSYPGCYRKNSVGKLCPNKEILFDDKGQIFVRGEACWAREYYKFPKEENEKVFRSDGYIATGDRGYIDGDGYIFIDGRIKEWIVLSNGKKVNPIEIELEFEKIRGIQQVILFGDKKPYIVALVFGKKVDSDGLDNQIQLCNKVLPDYGQIKKYKIIDEVLSMENKTLNSSLKVVRKNIYSLYQKQLDDMYKN